MSINRDEAKSWSVERIKFELDALYKKLQQLREDERDYLDWYEKEYSDPMKESQHDPNVYIEPITEAKSDIEFLENLIREKLV